jgi:hypothetical protein
MIIDDEAGRYRRVGRGIRGLGWRKLEQLLNRQELCEV